MLEDPDVAYIDGIPIAGFPVNITAGVNDDTGTSVTLTYTADNSGDTIYTYYRTIDATR